MTQAGAAAFAGNPELCGEVVRRECRGSHLLFFHGGGSNGTAAPPVQSAAASDSDPQRESLSMPDSSAPHAKKLRRRRTMLAVAVAVGTVLAALLLCAMIAMRRSDKRRRPSSASYASPNPKKSAPASQVSRDNADIGYVECVPDEETAAIMVPEEKARRLERSGCLTFCAGEAASYSLEQLMRASAEVLGRGSVGTTYKAVLDGRLVVIVKRLDAAKIGPAALEAEAFEQNMDAAVGQLHPYSARTPLLPAPPGILPG